LRVRAKLDTLRLPQIFRLMAPPHELRKKWDSLNCAVFLRGGVEFRHRDSDAVAQRAENTDQKVAGDVFEFVIQDGGNSGPGRSCPLGDRGVGDLSLPNDLLQMF